MVMIGKLKLIENGKEKNVGFGIHFSNNKNGYYKSYEFNFCPWCGADLRNEG